MTNLPKGLLYILIAGLLLRIFLFSTILYTQGADAFLISDSKVFLQTAENILAGNGFSRSAASPFLPDAHFPPLYPLLVAGSLKLASSIVPLLIFQILLGALLPLLVWKIGEMFTDKKAVHFLAAGLMAFEPVTGIFNLLVITDTVAVFSLVLAAFLFLRIFRMIHPARDAALAGLILGLSTLTKPNAQFLFILGLLFLFLFSLGRSVWKKARSSPALCSRTEGEGFLCEWQRAGRGNRALLTTSVFVAAFFFVLSPWLIRNTLQFGTPSVSSTGLRNLYTDFAVSVVSYDTGKPYGEVEEELKTSFAKQHGISAAQIGSDPSMGGALAREGLEIMFAHPRATLSVLTITLETFFTQDLYAYFAQKFHLIPAMTFDFSPSLVLLKEGPLTLASKVWELLGARAVIPLIGRLVWILITLFAVGGTYAAIKSKGRERAVAIFMVILIFYYAATSAVAAFSDQGRHRYPADAFLFLLASYGMISFLSSRRSHTP